MRYRIKEIFRTLQGEGALAGTPMVFVRFAGCNLWSGREADRTRDANRNQAECPRYCDTDFVGGEALGGEEIIARVRALPGPRWICYTGGEPLLQLDRALLTASRNAGYHAAVETNGTVDPAPVADLVDWLCVSPKTATVLARRGSELKQIWSSQDPRSLEPLMALDFAHHSLQPEDGARREEHLRSLLALLPGQDRWRLSLQTHKLTGLP